MKKWIGALALLASIAVLAGATEITFINSAGSFSGNAPTGGTYYFTASGVPHAAGLSITVNMSGLSVTLYDNASAGKTLTASGNTTWLWNVTTGHAYPMVGNWSIVVTNSSATDQPFGGNLTILNSSLRVNSSFATGTAVINENLGYSSKNFTYNFVIENNAGYALNITSVSSTPYLNNSNYYLEWNSNISMGTIAAGTNKTVGVNISYDNAKASNSSGTYTGSIAFVSTNGYPSTTYNLTVAVTMGNTLLVTVSNVTNRTSGTNTTNAGSWLNIIVAPKYQNGTVVAGLAGENFSASISHTILDTTKINGGCTVQLTNETKDDDTYLVKAYIPSTGGCGLNGNMVGGNYTVSVIATDPNGTNTGTGTWGGYLSVDESALYTTIYDNTAGTEISYGTNTKSAGTSWTVYPRIYNYGAKTATDVYVNHTISGDCSLSIGGTHIYIGTIAPGLSAINGSTWTFTVGSSNGTYCRVNVTGYSAIGNWALWSRNITMYIPTTAATPEVQMVTGNSESSTAPIDLSITSWPKYTSVMQGGTKTVDVTVKNSGSSTIENVKTKIEGLDSYWWTGTELSSLASGAEYTLPVTFTVPASATIKNYTIVYIAYSSNATARASADLAVLPSVVSQQSINSTLLNLTNKYNALLKKLESAAITGGNVSNINVTMLEAKALLDKARNYANSGDWFNANAAVAQLQAALNSAETKINALGAGSLGVALSENIALVAVVAIIIVAVVGGYIWFAKGGKLPSKFAPQSYKGQFGKGWGSKLKNALGKIKIKRKGSASYSYHYSG